MQRSRHNFFFFFFFLNLFPYSFYFPVQENKTMCPLGEVEKKAAQLIGK